MTRWAALPRRCFKTSGAKAVCRPLCASDGGRAGVQAPAGPRDWSGQKCVSRPASREAAIGLEPRTPGGPAPPRLRLKDQSRGSHPPRKTRQDPTGIRKELTKATE